MKHYPIEKLNMTITVYLLFWTKFTQQSWDKILERSHTVETMQMPVMSDIICTTKNSGKTWRKPYNCIYMTTHLHTVLIWRDTWISIQRKTHLNITYAWSHLQRIVGPIIKSHTRTLKGETSTRILIQKSLPRHCPYNGHLKSHNGGEDHCIKHRCQKTFTEDSALNRNMRTQFNPYWRKTI